ncbi:MAG: ABC transporter ATP-binding protein [Halobacteriota archaeon]
MNAIAVQGLTKVYDDKSIAVDNASFTVERGAAFGLLGPIGAGKSSIINVLLNFTAPTSGTIKIFDHEIPAQFQDVQYRVGYLPERPGFYDHFSAEKNLRFFANLSKITDGRDEKIQNLFLLAGLEGKEKLPISAYSLGDRKRLGIAAAMLNDPELLVLDEPSTGLDPQGRRDVMELIHELNAHNVTLFLATHSVRDVAEICDVVAPMKLGHVNPPISTKNFIAAVRGKTVLVEAEIANLNERVLQAIKSVRGVKSIECEHLRIVLDFRPNIKEDVSYVITRAGGRVRSLRDSPSLEEAYVKMMGRWTVE